MHLCDAIPQPFAFSDHAAIKFYEANKQHFQVGLNAFYEWFVHKQLQ